MKVNYFYLYNMWDYVRIHRIIVCAKWIITSYFKYNSHSESEREKTDNTIFYFITISQFYLT